MRLFALIILLVASVDHALAETTVASSQAEAIKQWPALAKPDSKFNKRFVQIHALAKEMNDPLLNSSDWPMKLAKFVSLEVRKGSTYHHVPAQFVAVAGTITGAVNHGVVVKVDDAPQFAALNFAPGTHMIFVNGNFGIVDGRVVQYEAKRRIEANLVYTGTVELIALDQDGKSMGPDSNIKSTPLRTYSTIEDFITHPMW